MLAALAILKGLWNPAVLVLGLALFGGGLYTGNRLTHQAAKADRLDAVQRAIEQANELASQDAEILATADVRREKLRVAMKQLDQEIEKNVEANPSYLECGLDAVGLLNWNAGNAGIAPDLSGERGYGLPAAATGRNWQAVGVGQEPQSSDRPIPPVQRPVPNSIGAGE